MSLFDFFKMPDINQELLVYDETPDAILLDVRTEEEYGEGHIPGSKNIPLQSIDKVRELTDNGDTPLFVYCRSGARSRQAAAFLGHMGYTQVRNMGGIAAYQGKVERLI